MVENIRELHCQRYAHAFGELDLFRQGGVKVPLRHAAQVVDAAAACVVTQNAASEIIVERCRIVEHVQFRWSINGSNAVGSATFTNQMRPVTEVGIDG